MLACMYLFVLPFPHSHPYTDGVYASQAAILYCMKVKNVEIGSDVPKNASR